MIYLHSSVANHIVCKMAEATGSNPSLVFVKGSTIFETTYDAHRERAFSFVQRKLFLRFPDDHNLSYMQVTQVRDGNSQIVHLTNIAIPPSYHPWFDQRTDGDIEGWIEHWNISRSEERRVGKSVDLGGR